MGKDLEKKYQLSKVQIFQSRSLARITLVIKGDIDFTTPKLKAIQQILSEGAPKEID